MGTTPPRFAMLCSNGQSTSRATKGTKQQCLELWRQASNAICPGCEVGIFFCTKLGNHTLHHPHVIPTFASMLAVKSYHRRFLRLPSGLFCRPPRRPLWPRLSLLLSLLLHRRFFCFILVFRLRLRFGLRLRPRFLLRLRSRVRPLLLLELEL